jgi:hypothetical protein
MGWGALRWKPSNLGGGIARVCLRVEQERKRKGHLISPRRNAPGYRMARDYSFLTFLAAGPF